MNADSAEIEREEALEAPIVEEKPVDYTFSGGLAARLAQLDLSIAFTSYQSGWFYLIGRRPDGGLHLHQSAIARPMGLAFDGSNRLVMCSGAHITQFENVLAAHEQINHEFDACYVPRVSHLTGSLDAHDIGIAEDGSIVFVNTGYNCLATLSPRHSFKPVWRPPFISALIAEDRCHLNGLAMEAGEAAYVTAVSRSDTIDGWRDRRASGGIVMDVRTNEILCEGLSMPHSPRVHNGKLWVLNAGTGEFGFVSRNKDGKGKFEPLVFCPGFLRGLAFHGNYAFIGLSKPRYKRFEGLGLDAKLQERDSEAWCGIQIIDLAKGACVDWFRIDGAVAELYDVAVVSGFARPMAISPHSADAANLITIDTELHASPPGAETESIS